MTEQGFFEFILEQHEKLTSQALQHLGLTFLSLFFAVLVGVPLGILIVGRKALSNTVLGIAGILQTVPSIALLGFMIPAFGIGATPAIVALLIYALLPIIRNTYTGISGVSPAVIEAAKALGMNKKQRLIKVELPLAMPTIIAGIRTAAVINVGVATLASFVAAGGLGEFIFGGISLNNTNMILAGAIPAAILAVFLDQAIAFIQGLGYKNIRKFFRWLPFVLVFIGLYYVMTMTPKKDDIKAGFTPEFMGRQDGDLGLRSVYGLKVNPVIVGDAIMYKAAYEKELDLISGYSTDGRIKAYDLVVLEDNKKIFPPYYAAPIVKETTLKKYPQLKPALNLLADQISDSMMTELNYRADFKKLTPEKIAKEFLVSKGLYKTPRKGNGPTIKIGSKIFGEQYILSEIYKMLIEGNTDYRVETKTGLGGTQICFDALTSGAIDMYPEYTGTGLLVLLKPDENTVRKVTASPEETFNYVNKEFKNRYGTCWLPPIGFSNSYALMMRSEQAQALGLKTISDLTKLLNK